MLPAASLFIPLNVPPKGRVVVSYPELEAMRLVDVEGLTHEEAASRMGVSRKTFWMDLKSGRRKVVEALTNGMEIKIIGGQYLLKQKSSSK